MSKLSNKRTFNFFIGVNIIIVLLMLFFVGFLIYAINSGVKNSYQHYHLGFYPFLIITCGLIRNKIALCYFEAEISTECILIKTINPTKYNGIRFIQLLFNKIEPSEFIIDRVSFTNYRIVISKLGFKKKLILQKFVKGDLFESKPIDIDFLGYKKYTDLIISIDRLSQKMSLN